MAPTLHSVMTIIFIFVTDSVKRSSPAPAAIGDAALLPGML
jgi:hypothetical protein